MHVAMVAHVDAHGHLIALAQGCSLGVCDKYAAMCTYGRSMHTANERDRPDVA